MKMLYYLFLSYTAKQTRLQNAQKLMLLFQHKNTKSVKIPEISEVELQPAVRHCNQQCIYRLENWFDMLIPFLQEATIPPSV